MKKLWSKFTSYLKNHKRSIVSYLINFVVLFIGFISCSVLCLGAGDSLCESVARKMGDDTYECEVVSSKQDDNLQAIFNYADDMGGREIKDSIDTYVVSYTDNDTLPAFLSLDSGIDINVDSVLQYTTWKFEIYNYGFKTLTGNQTRNISSKEIYINKKIAEEIALSLGCDEIDLVGLSVKILTNSSRTIDLTIVDIITNLDSINLGPYFVSQNCIVTNYTVTYNYFKNIKYITVLKSGYLAKNYAIHRIENTISFLNKKSVIYSSRYDRLVDNKLVDDGIQNLVNNTKVFYNSNHRLLLLFCIPAVCIILYICLAAKFNKIKSEFIVSAFSSITFYSIFIRFICPYIIVSDHIILLSNSVSAFLSAVLFIVLLSSFYLFKPDGKKTKESQEERDLA